MPDTPEAPATTEQPAAPVSTPAAPANNQPESPSPFADGTGWDQIQRNDLIAKPEPPREFVFADGKKITDIDYRKPLQAEAPPSAQTEPAKSGDTSAQTTDPAKPTEPAAIGDTSSATAQSGEQDFSGLLNKYGTDQKSWAKAFAGLQKQMSKQAEAIKAYQTTLVNQIRERAPSDAPVNPLAPAASATVAAPDKPAATAFDKTAEVTAIMELLGSEPEKAFERLITLTETVAEQKSRASAEAFWQSEQAKQSQAQQARQEQEIKANNESMVWNRVREMKLAAAQAANDKDAIARYSNEKYQIDEADYIDVMPSIQAELDFIAENNMLPKDGKLSPALFKRVQLLLDPPDIQKIISDAEARAEARTRAQVLAEISKSQNANGQRVSIQPAANAPIRSNEIDLTKYEGWHPTDIQNEVFANMSDDAIAAAKEKFMQSYNRAAA